MKMSKRHNYYTIMKNNNQEKECDENASSVLMWSSMIGAVILVVVGVCVYPYVLRFFVGCKDVNILGPYGDMYGPLNPLVSAFAFIALVYSLSMQGRQLKLQRKDLQNQREDLALQRKEMEKQREVSEAQTRQFEAQVELAEKGQKIDELYKRLTIVVQLAEAVVFASINTSISSEARRQESEFSEKATRAIILIHNNLISILRTVEKDAKLLQTKKLYIYDRFLNIERWLGATLNVLQYVRHNFDEEEAACVWQNTLDKENGRTNISIKIEDKQSGEKYSESFYEYFYSLDAIEEMLKKSGLKICKIVDGENFEEVKPTSQRYLFMVKKES